MLLLAAPWAALAWLGRQGTRAIAAVVFLAIIVPPLDAVLRPFVTEAIFALLCIAFVRVDTADLRGLEYDVVGHEHFESRLRDGEPIRSPLEIGCFVVAIAVRRDAPLDVGCLSGEWCHRSTRLMCRSL